MTAHGKAINSRNAVYDTASRDKIGHSNALACANTQGVAKPDEEVPQ